MAVKCRRQTSGSEPANDDHLKSFEHLEGAGASGVIITSCRALVHCFNSICTGADMLMILLKNNVRKLFFYKSAKKPADLFSCNGASGISFKKNFQGRFKINETFRDRVIEILEKRTIKSHDEKACMLVENDSYLKVNQNKNQIRINFKSIINDFRKSQLSDNEQVNPSAIIIDNNNNNNNNNITYNNNSNINNNNTTSYGHCPFDVVGDDAFKFFEGKNSYNKLSRNVSSYTSRTDIKNDDVARALAKRMYYDCIFKNKIGEMKNVQSICAETENVIASRRRKIKLYDALLRKFLLCETSRTKSDDGAREKFQPRVYELCEGRSPAACVRQIMPGHASSLINSGYSCGTDCVILSEERFYTKDVPRQREAECIRWSG